MATKQAKPAKLDPTALKTTGEPSETAEAAIARAATNPLVRGG